MNPEDLIFRCRTVSNSGLHENEKFPWPRFHFRDQGLDLRHLMALCNSEKVTVAAEIATGFFAEN